MTKSNWYIIIMSILGVTATIVGFSSLSEYNNIPLMYPAFCAAVLVAAGLSIIFFIITTPGILEGQLLYAVLPQAEKVNIFDFHKLGISQLTKESTTEGKQTYTIKWENEIDSLLNPVIVTEGRYFMHPTEKALYKIVEGYIHKYPINP